MEQRSHESAEAEVRDLDAKLPPTAPPADLGGGRIRPAALVRWGFFAGVGLLLAYGAAQALLSVRNLLVLVLVAMLVSRSLVSAAMAACDHAQLQHPRRARHQYQQCAEQGGE